MMLSARVRRLLTLLAGVAIVLAGTTLLFGIGTRGTAPLVVLLGWGLVLIGLVILAAPSMSRRRTRSRS
jgi:hypothetical protein